LPVTILANRYNTLQARVAKILGAPTVPGYGYGSIVSSSPVYRYSITDDQYINLYKDIVRIDAHQNGESSITIDPFVVGNFNSNPSADKIEEAYIAGLESEVNTLDVNRFSIAASQLQIDILRNVSNLQISSTRSLQWRNTISHIFTVDFGTSSNRNAFFNAGGQIRPELALNYTGGESKTISWQVLFNTIGAIKIAGSSTRDSQNSGSNLGLVNCNASSYTRLYQSASAQAYSNNLVTIDAKLVGSANASKIQIKVNCQDSHGENIDEYVRGATTGTVFTAIPDGTVQIGSSILDTVVYSGNLLGSTITSF
tara:strand:+ start:3430 stop:4365 length:936 start_codon:yes stop_codon:yes gene_type:complete